MCRCFQISNAGGVSVGTITKVWRGCGAEAFTDSDNFRLDLDQAVSNEDKALLLGATFLIVSGSVSRDNETRYI